MEKPNISVENQYYEQQIISDYFADHTDKNLPEVDPDADKPEYDLEYSFDLDAKDEDEDEMLYYDDIMEFRDVLVQYYKTYDVPKEQIDYYLYEILRQQEPPFWRTSQGMHPLSIRGMFEDLEQMIPRQQPIKIIEPRADQLSIDGFYFRPKPDEDLRIEITQMSPEETEQLAALKPVDKLDIDYMTWHSELRDKADKIVEEARYCVPDDDF